MPPVSALVDFLRTFGPVATSDSLCDENLKQAQADFGVKPIDTLAPRLEDVKAALLAPQPTNVILTGTAGDGKTYHIRKFFMDVFPDEAGAWPGEDGILKLPLPPDRELRIIRDLSEISDSEKAAELTSLSAALLGECDHSIYLIAANDGQLLKYFRDAMRRGGDGAEAARTLYHRLSDMLREEQEQRPDLNLSLMNLSRTWSEAVVDRIFDAVLDHPGWGEACKDCAALSDAKPCPILLNRSLLQPSENGPSVFRSRLKEALRLAAANDQHVPVRQLLVLVVNILLGDSKKPDDPLMDCATATGRAKAAQYSCTNPYNNAVGLNLRPERRRANRVFNVFEVLAVGFETNNLIDNALVQRQPQDVYEALFADDPIYGKTMFEPLRNAYFLSGGAGSGPADAAIREFRIGLEAQRRRAFFRLPGKGSREMAIPWRLSIYQHGGDYLTLQDALVAGGDRETIDRFTHQLLRGLNRAFSGMMTIDDQRLWLAGTIGKTDDPAGRISTLEPIDRTSATSFNVRLALDAVRCRPCLRVMPPRLAKQTPVSELAMRPLLFEYLMRVANGSLPSSFSRQCHQEIRHFALVTQTAIQDLMAGDDDQPQVVRVLSLGSRGEIQAQPLEVTR